MDFKAGSLGSSTDQQLRCVVETAIENLFPDAASRRTQYNHGLNAIRQERLENVKMPLRDHFHSPLVDVRHWHSFHNAWATYLAEDLNSRLPDGYFAEPHVQFGIEIDVAALHDQSEAATVDKQNSAESAYVSWKPSSPTAVIDFPFVTDIVELLVFKNQAGPVLAGAIELVSPANKDRPQSRDSFIAKCRNYLQVGVGLVIVDTVTSFRFNLHRELLADLNHDEIDANPCFLYASSYHLIESGSTKMQIWNEPLALREVLPMMPLWLDHNFCVPVDLEVTYEHTCRKLRITDS
jgi:hypothetical protein